MSNLEKKYEKKHLENILKANQKIKQAFEDSIFEISLAGSKVSYKGEVFELAKFPQLQQKIEALVNKLHAYIYSTTINSIEISWNLSNEKNNLIVDKRLAGKKPSQRAKQILYDPNHEAMQQFIYRKEKGMNLSKRVWRSLGPLKTELEKGLGVGISEGKPAIEMAKDLKQYLNNPDKLFRRVRDAEGKLKLSHAAKNYHPGQGVYRSSFQNALRLTGTETNLAYRSADHERWKQLPFVKGILVHTSNSHPEYDICDQLKGQYPKDFKFTGWHVKCICYATAEQISDEEYDKMEDAILGIGDSHFEPKQIETVPAGFNQWMQENEERIKGWKNKPYWIKDNKQYV